MSGARPLLLSTIADPSAAVLALAIALLASTALLFATLSPASALGASGTITDQKLGITVPASARVHIATTGTTATTATIPTTTTPASAQPGTVPPTTTTGAGATPGTTSTPGTTATTSTTPTTATPSAPAPGSTTVVVVHKTESHATRLSTGALVLAIIGALLVLACVVWGLARWLALEPRWTVSLTHSLREAGYRGSATWAEFSDWARIGR